MDYLVSKVSVWAIGKFDARVRACELSSTRHPADARSFIKEINWVEELHPFFHDELNTQHLSFIVTGNQLGRQNFNHSISILLLRICHTKWQVVRSNMSSFVDYTFD